MDGAGVGWAGVIMGAVSLVGTVYSQFNARKAQRDKLEFELKTKELELRDADRTKELDALRAQNAQQGRQIADLQRSHSDCETKHERVAAELAQLRAELLQKKDRTDGHKPL